MIYEYCCPSCDREFEVVKPVAQYKTPETCSKCEVIADKVIRTAVMTTTMERAEYNPGLGCVVKNKQHRAELCKRKGLIEVGNERKEDIHKSSASTLKQNLKYKEV